VTKHAVPAIVLAPQCLVQSARSVAMMAHSLVKKFCRNSGMAIFQHLHRRKDQRPEVRAKVPESLIGYSGPHNGLL